MKESQAECKFDCPLFNSPEIRGSCPASEISDRKSALAYCKLVSRGRRQTRGINRATIIDPDTSVTQGLSRQIIQRFIKRQLGTS